MAAVLACSPDAVLSHRDAAHLWELRRSASARIEVTAPRSRHGLDGIVVHRVRRLDPRDQTVREGIPVTTVARALLDNAEVLPERQVERMIEEAERLRLFDLADLRDTCERSPGRRGLSPLIACLGATLAEPPHTKSDLEQMFLDLCRDADLPEPAFNVVVEGYEVDAHWPGTNLIIELDSWSFHRTRESFERDHARDLALAAYKVLRLTWRQLTNERPAITRTIRGLLDSARTHRALGRGALAHASP
jgi:very-short-patch-repair endonuclease